MLPVARLRRYAGGGYALAVVDREGDRYTLVRGDARRARVVHVDGRAWTEATAAEVPAPVGAAARTIALSGRDGEVRRRSVTRYPRGTRREDRATFTRGGVERATRWAWVDGRSAKSEWSRGGRQVTYFDADRPVSGVPG